jgi:hypothetical protein
MPRLGDLDVPTQFYTILEEPAPLAGMPYPRSGAPWQLFYEHGFRHVVNLASDDPGYNPAPLSLLFAASLEDLFHRQPPRLPAREEEPGRLYRASGASPGPRTSRSASPCRLVGLHLFGTFSSRACTTARMANRR